MRPPLTLRHSDGHNMIWHGDCLDLSLPVRAKIGLGDPPYTDKTHKGARSNRNGGIAQVTFASFAYPDLYVRLAHLAEFVETWMILTCDWRHSALLETEPPPGWEFVRAMIWVKPNGMPQRTGDRPGTGWEALALLHRTNPDGSPARKRWNGHGRDSVFTHEACESLGTVLRHNVVRSASYPTEKPESLINELLSLFANDGDSVLDPFCGSGTTLVCANNRGMTGYGCDISEEAVQLTIKRLSQGVLLT